MATEPLLHSICQTPLVRHTLQERPLNVLMLCPRCVRRVREYHLGEMPDWLAEMVQQVLDLSPVAAPEQVIAAAARRAEWEPLGTLEPGLHLHAYSLGQRQEK